MYSLTVSGILTIIAIVEVEYITELCRHEQRHFYNVLVTFTMGISWCVQLLFALVYSTGSDVGRGATQATSCLSSPVSPPTQWRRKRWCGKRMYAGRLLGRSRRFRQAGCLHIRYNGNHSSPWSTTLHGRSRSSLHNATHAGRNALRVRLRRSRIHSIVAGGSHTTSHRPNCRCFALVG
jgi:hypothetical protein